MFIAKSQSLYVPGCAQQPTVKPSSGLEYLSRFEGVQLPSSYGFLAMQPDTHLHDDFVKLLLNTAKFQMYRPQKRQPMALQPITNNFMDIPKRLPSNNGILSSKSKGQNFEGAKFVVSISIRMLPAIIHRFDYAMNYNAIKVRL
jgi:hypothetical protein